MMMWTMQRSARHESVGDCSECLALRFALPFDGSFRGRTSLPGVWWDATQQSLCLLQEGLQATRLSAASPAAGQRGSGRPQQATPAPAAARGAHGLRMCEVRRALPRRATLFILSALLQSSGSRRTVRGLRSHRAANRVADNVGGDIVLLHSPREMGYGHAALLTQSLDNLSAQRRANRPAGGSPARANRQRSPEANSPAFGESWASKRGGAYLQAAMNMNSAASKQAPVRERAGRARALWAKAAVRAVDSGAAWNRSDVKEAACRESRLVNWGDPPAPAGEIDRRGSEPWYKAPPKSGAVRRESEWGVVPLTVETTQLGPRKGPTLR